MSLYRQPNNWSCGPFALKHALVMLGRFVDEDNISRIAGAHWWSGTDDIKLARAARAFGCELKFVRRKKADRAKRELLAHLRRGYPALLCVYDWNHWITVVNAERGKYVVIDSREQPVVSVLTWSQLKNIWVYRDEDPDDVEETMTLFDLHPVIPKFRVKTKAKFSLKRVRYLRRPENRAFGTHWDEYFEDLLTICKPRTPRSTNFISMGEFLHRHYEMLVDQVSHWHGGVKENRIGKVLRNMQFVADTYGLVIEKDDVRRAIAAIACNLTMWACSRYSVNSVYGKN